jgi:hypothetical protein
LKGLPEMIFGYNYISLSHESGFSMSFNAKDALKMVDNEKAPPIKVASSTKWLNRF